MYLEISPYRSVGPFLLGSLKEDINLQLGEQFEYVTYSYSDDSADDYSSIGLRFEYDNRLRCISIDISLPARPFFYQKNLLSFMPIDLKKYFNNENRAFIQDENILLLDTGLAFNFGDISKLNNARIVTIFEKNLFDPFLDNYSHFSLP
jgi:hypothetical protein